MDEKSAEKEIAEGNATMQSEEIGSEEAISASESPGITTESTNEDSEKDNKLTTSEIQSDTLCIDIVSGSTSASEISCEKSKSVVTQEKLSDSLPHNEPTETELLTSVTELICEDGSVSVANERTESPVESSIPSVAEIPSTDAVQSPLPSESDHMAACEMESLSRPSNVPCEQASCTEENKAASTEASPEAKTLIGVIKSLLSPSKSKAKKSPSKSMSPSKKIKLNREEESTSAPEVPIASEGQDNVANENKKGILKGFKELLSFGKNKPSGNERFVDGEKTEASTEIKQPTTNERSWFDDRRSLTDIDSLGGTTMTDVPSTSSSSGVFSAESSRRQSAAEENECEAVANDLSGSAEVLDSNINENNTRNESQMNSLSNEEGQESASDNIDQQRVPSKEKSIKD